MVGTRRCAAVAASVLLATALWAPASQGAPPSAKSFDSCGELVSYAKQRTLDTVNPGRAVSPVPRINDVIMEAPQSVSVGAGDQKVAPMMAPAESNSAAPDGSGTNIQEPGVDEPDDVKVAGSKMFTVSNGTLYALDIAGGNPRVRGSLELEAARDSELLLAGDRLLVISRTTEKRPPLSAGEIRTMEARLATRLTEVDVSDPAHMTVGESSMLQGSYVSARLVDGTVRLVISAALHRGGSAAEPDNDGRWLPTYALKRGDQQAGDRWLVRCNAVRRPRQFSGLNLLTVLTIDLGKGLSPVDSDALMTDARIVYSSRDRMYITSERWIDGDYAQLDEFGTRTTIHEFSLDGRGRTTYRASGTVRGVPLNQFSMSERGGLLRVASTEQPQWLDDGSEQGGESFVTVLDSKGGALERVGQVDGIGRGEQVYSVRFIGDAAFVVTFRQTDPLFTVDLSAPLKPRVLGELKIEGNSSYLHPAGNDLLIGVGQDADADGVESGTQLSLFDVSNLRRPLRLAHKRLGNDAYSEAESNHHAFLYWPPTGLTVLPVQYDTAAGVAVGLRVGRGSGIEQVGKVSHGSGGYRSAIRRSLVAGNRLLTVSDEGVKASSLQTLAGLGFAPFK